MADDDVGGGDSVDDIMAALPTDGDVDIGRKLADMGLVDLGAGGLHVWAMPPTHAWARCT